MSFSDSSRRGDVHARQRHALVVADGTTLGDRADHVVAVDVLHDQPDLAVVDQHPVARGGIGSQLLVGGRHPVVVAGAVLDGDTHRFAVRPVGGAVGETPQSDLGALKVGEHTDCSPGGVRGAAHPLVGRLVVFVSTVAEVQAGHVHARVDQCPDHLRGVGRRTKSADDLSASIHGASIVE